MVSFISFALTLLLPKDALWILVVRESERVRLVETKHTTVLTILSAGPVADDLSRWVSLRLSAVY